MDARRQVLAHEVDARDGDELRVEAAGGDDLRLARPRLPAEGAPAQLAAHDDVPVGEQLGARVDGAEHADRALHVELLAGAQRAVVHLPWVWVWVCVCVRVRVCVCVCVCSAYAAQVRVR